MILGYASVLMKSFFQIFFRHSLYLGNFNWYMRNLITMLGDFYKSAMQKLIMFYNKSQVYLTRSAPASIKSKDFIEKPLIIWTDLLQRKLDGNSCKRKFILWDHILPTYTRISKRFKQKFKKQGSSTSLPSLRLLRNKNAVNMVYILSTV